MKIFVISLIMIVKKVVNLSLSHEIAFVDNYLNIGKFRKTMKYLERYYFNTYTKITLPGKKTAYCYSPIDPLIPESDLTNASNFSNEERIRTLHKVLKGLCAASSSTNNLEYVTCPGYYTSKAPKSSPGRKDYIGLDSMFNTVENLNISSQIASAENASFQAKEAKPVKKVEIKQKIAVYVSSDYAVFTDPKNLIGYKFENIYRVKFFNVTDKAEMEAFIDMKWPEGMVKLSNMSMEVKKGETLQFERAYLLGGEFVRDFDTFKDEKKFRSEFLKPINQSPTKEGDIIVSKNRDNGHHRVYRVEQVFSSNFFRIHSPFDYWFEQIALSIPRENLEKFNIKGLKFYNCTLVVKNNTVIGTSDCPDIQNITILGNRIINFLNEARIIAISDTKKIDLTQTMNLESPLLILKPWNYRVVKPGYVQSKSNNPHILTKHIKKIFFDINVHSEKSFTGYTSKSFSSSNNNIALISITKHSPHNNIKLVLYTGDDPEIETSHKIWIELQENNRLTVFNPRTRKSIQTDVIKKRVDVETGELFEFGIYLCKKSKTLVIFKGIDYIVENSIMGFFYDEEIPDIENIDYHQQDTYGMSINSLSTTEEEYEDYEWISSLKQMLKPGDEKRYFEETQKIDIKCPESEKKFQNTIKWKCNPKQRFEVKEIWHVNHCHYDMEVHSYYLCPVKYNDMDDMDFSKTLCLLDNQKNKPFIEGIRRHGLNDVKSY